MTETLALFSSLLMYLFIYGLFNDAVSSFRLSGVTKEKHYTINQVKCSLVRDLDPAPA